MSICVFLGPTLSVEAAKQVLDAVYLPPAGHGDIYRATLWQPKPRIIGLIDGRYRQGPAVRHKEILWAMAEGIHVFGAASMGALRAVELSDFGMIGVGHIFEDLVAGRIEDDDELAVDHGPPELNYVSANVAMVDISATLARALEQGVIGAQTHALLSATTKRMYYAERSYERLLEEAGNVGASSGELNALHAWLPQGRVNQKRDDALALLTMLSNLQATDPPPKTVSYVFERTEAWDIDMAFAAPAGNSPEPDSRPILREALLDELRLVPELHRRVRREALARALVLREAERQHLAIDDRAVQSEGHRWARQHDIVGSSAIAAWCAANYLDEAGFHDLIAEEARQRRLEAVAEPLIDHHTTNALRACCEYAPLVARALSKQQLLEEVGGPDFAPSLSCVSIFDLLVWYCEQKLKKPLPHNVADFAADLGFSDLPRFYRALRLEYLFERMRESHTNFTRQIDKRLLCP
jgi:hypothetical protein